MSQKFSGKGYTASGMTNGFDSVRYVSSRNSNGTISGSGSPWKGSEIYPTSDMTVHGFKHRGTVTEAGVYRGAIMTMTSTASDATIATILWTETATATAADASYGHVSVFFRIPQQILSTGRYYFMLGRTEQADTWAFPCGYSETTKYPFQTSSYTYRGCRISKTTPAIGDSPTFYASAYTSQDTYYTL